MHPGFGLGSSCSASCVVGEEQEGERPDMTGPERLVRSHMRSRGIRSIAELQRMLVAEGYELSYERVRRAVKYPSRTRNVQALEAICEALQLGYEEMIRSISAPRRLRVFRY